LIINEIPDVIYIPQESIFEKEEKKIVYLKNNGGFDEQEVTVGDKSENYIVITKGVEEGAEVALRDPNEIIEEGVQGSEVKGLTQQMPASK
jgi:hypothetical protein